MGYLIDSVAKSLKLDQYKKDVDYDVYCRMVAYSGACMWVRAAIKDEGGISNIGSERHVSSVCNHFLDALSKENPHIVEWFGDSSPGLNVIDNMIQAGLIEKYGFNPYYLGFPDNAIWSLSEDKHIMVGDVGFTPTDNDCAGPSVISSAKMNYSPLDLIDNNYFIEWYLGTLNYRKPDYKFRSSGAEVFHPDSSKYYSQSDYKTSPFSIIQENYPGKKEYFIETNRGVYKIEDPFTINYNVHRFEYYLMSINGATSVYLGIKGGLFLMSLPEALPAFERSVITSFSWPYRSIKDRGRYLIPICCKAVVENILNHLGVKYVWSRTDIA